MSIAERRLLRDFHEIYESSGVENACLNLLEQVNVSLETINPPSKHGPLLIIANHPGGVDGLALCASTGRSDYYQIALASFNTFGKTFEDRILPIYRAKNVRDFFVGLVAPNLLGHIINDQAEIQKSNRDTIKKAADLVNNEMCVAIFPTGTGGKSLEYKSWKSGVGHLVNQLVNHDSIVFAHIKGTNKTDYARFLSLPFKQSILGRKSVSVTFSDTFNLKCTSTDPKDITKILEYEYRRFAHSSTTNLQTF